METLSACPRRMNEAGPWEHKEGLDKFVLRLSYLHCSFCGGLHPTRFLTMVEQGMEVTPTDKNYKAYVNGGMKFYFQHLSDVQMVRFVELYNSKVMNVGYPGYFYVLPFFMVLKHGIRP